MSEVVVKVERKSDYSTIYVDGKICGKISDYGDENSATVTDVITRLIDKLDVNTVVKEERR